MKNNKLLDALCVKLFKSRSAGVKITAFDDEVSYRMFTEDFEKKFILEFNEKIHLNNQYRVTVKNENDGMNVEMVANIINTGNKIIIIHLN